MKTPFRFIIAAASALVLALAILHDGGANAEPAPDAVVKNMTE